MWNPMRRALALILLTLWSAASMAVPAALAEGEPFERSIRITTENRGFGNEVIDIVMTVDDTADFRALTPEDYTLSRCMVDKRMGTEVDMHPTAVDYTDTEIRLAVEPFILKSSHRHFAFTCTDERLNFTYDDIDEILCPNVDCFTDETITVGERTLQYHLYSPESDAPLPVVIYNHGGGCTGYEGVLTDDCFASAWVTGDAQETFPCYVVAPYRASVNESDMKVEDELACVKAIIDGMIADGRVDADRVYMGGESMGCIFTMTFGNAYPGVLAAEILMDGGPFDVPADAALEDAVQKDLMSPWSDAELQTLAQSGTAVAVVQGVGDTLSIPIRLATVYRKLVALGMADGEKVAWVPYSADKFNELLRSTTKIFHVGKDEATRITDPITGEETWQDGLFHNSSRVTAWDPFIREWLAGQALSKPYETVYPSQTSAKEDAEGDFTFSETAMTIPYGELELAATLAMPDAEEPAPLVLMCHGYTGSQNHFNNYAEVLATNGIASLRFDFPANGMSTGESTQISLLTEKDVAAFMLNYAKGLDGVDADRLFLCGQSMGGMVAALCAVEHLNEIQGVILCYPGFPIPQFTREGSVLGTDFDLENIPETLEIYGYTVGAPFITDALDIDVYGKVLPSLDKDVLIFHGTTDDMIDLQYSVQALDVLPSAKLVVVDGYGHGFPGFVLADIMPIVVDFINAH